MKDTTVIASFYNVAPQMACIKRFFPSKLILFAQKAKPKSAEEKALNENEKLLAKTIGSILDIERVDIENQYDVYGVARKAVEIIERERKKGKEIIINITGGRRTQALGLLFAAYARSNMVKKIVYTTEEKNDLIDMPKVGLWLSKPKKQLLAALEKNPKNISELARGLKKTRAIIYRHLNELEDMGYVTEDFEITEAGKLALL